MKQYKDVIIEISEACNAKCKYCTTGILNCEEGIHEGEFMTAAKFRQGVDYLLQNNIIAEDSHIMLYNYGEPLLNPELVDIVRIVHEKKMTYTVSTNGSKYVEIPRELMASMKEFLISLSGFSDDTYLHGFSIEKIKQNIVKYANYFKECGMQSKLKVNFHVYQSNFREVALVKRFCEENDIVFYPHFAYFADFDLFEKYLRKDYQNEVVRAGTQELFTFWYDEYTKKCPEKYRCPQFDILTFNQRFELLICCSKMMTMGNLFELSNSEIEYRKENNSFCVGCIRDKHHFLLHNMPEVSWHFGFEREEVTKGKTELEAFFKVYFDKGNGFNEIDCLPVGYKDLSQLNQYHIEFPAEVRAIRIDPVEKTGCVLEDFRIIGVPEGYKEKFDDFTKVYAGGVIVMNSDDPHISVTFNSERREIDFQMKLSIVCN